MGKIPFLLQPCCELFLSVSSKSCLKNRWVNHFIAPEYAHQPDYGRATVSYLQDNNLHQTRITQAQWCDVQFMDSPLPSHRSVGLGQLARIEKTREK